MDPPVAFRARSLGHAIPGHLALHLIKSREETYEDWCCLPHRLRVHQSIKRSDMDPFLLEVRRVVNHLTLGSAKAERAVDEFISSTTALSAAWSWWRSFSAVRLLTISWNTTAHPASFSALT